MAIVITGRRTSEPIDGAVSFAGRGLVDGLPTPRPLGAELPAVFQEDDFCQRMMAALDEVLAPAFATLDCFDSYLDAQLAPPDFVDWLAAWVGIDIDETWTLERLRDLIRNAATLYRIRGTAAGLAAHVRLYTGVTPEIEETGGCEWSQTAESPLPGSLQPHLTVRLRVDDPAGVRRSTVTRIVAASPSRSCAVPAGDAGRGGSSGANRGRSPGGRGRYSRARGGRSARFRTHRAGAADTPEPGNARRRHQPAAG